MKRPEPDSRASRRRSQTAAEWLARRDRGLTATEQDEFVQWLAEDPRHGEWFAVHRRMMDNYGALAQWQPELSTEPNPDLLAPPRQRVGWARRVSLAAAAVVVGALLWHQVAPDETDTATAAASAEIERRILADGSAVELNRGAAVKVEFSEHERRVVLVRGEALFTVTKDAARPFIVRAGDLDVRAVGTAFAVRLERAAVEVLVTEGRVALVAESVASRPTSAAPEPYRAARTPATTDLAGNARELGAGQRATVYRDRGKPPEIVAVTPAETARLLTWQPQLLDFSSAPLEAAVVEFNRRNRVQFVLTDPQLAAMPIVASIRSDNVDGFARVLAATPGLEVERRGELEIVVRRKR